MDVATTAEPSDPLPTMRKKVESAKKVGGQFKAGHVCCSQTHLLLEQLTVHVAMSMQMPGNVRGTTLRTMAHITACRSPPAAGGGGTSGGAVGF